jgi:hypothetical protein
MSLIDLFLDQDTESDRIRKLSRQIATRSKKDKANSALKRTRDDVGFLALALLAAVKLLEEKGVFNEEEFVSRIVSLDKIDGLMDGKIDPDQLRQALGFKPGLRARRKVSKVRKVRRTSQATKPPEARLIVPPLEPHAKRTKTARKRRASRSKTLAWKESAVPAPATPAVPAAPTAPTIESMPAPAAPKPLEMPDMSMDLPDMSVDPATLGGINFDDYYGSDKKE